MAVVRVAFVVEFTKRLSKRQKKNTIIIFKFNFLLIGITRNNHVNTNEIVGYDIRKCKKNYFHKSDSVFLVVSENKLVCTIYISETKLVEHLK